MIINGQTFRKSDPKNNIKVMLNGGSIRLGKVPFQDLKLKDIPDLDDKRDAILKAMSSLHEAVNDAYEAIKAARPDLAKNLDWFPVVVGG
jgi:hypothetical protein